MKTYPMAGPPTHAGIYTIIHKPTGKLYIGRSVDLRRRYSEWKAVFTSKLGIKNMKILSMANSTQPEEWEFSVLFELPGATDRALEEFEAKSIRHVANTRPNDVLNGLDPIGGSIPAKQAGSVARTEIIGPSGESMSYSEAASELRVGKQAVKKRLAKWRQRGIFKVQLTDLMKKSGVKNP